MGKLSRESFNASLRLPTWASDLSPNLAKDLTVTLTLISLDCLDTKMIKIQPQSNRKLGSFSLSLGVPFYGPANYKLTSHSVLQPPNTLPSAWQCASFSLFASSSRKSVPSWAWITSNKVLLDLLCLKTTVYAKPYQRTQNVYAQQTSKPQVSLFPISHWN